MISTVRHYILHHVRRHTPCELSRANQVVIGYVHQSRRGNTEQTQTESDTTARTSHGTGQTSEDQPKKGRLKLSIYMNYGHLTIHIIKAKNLDSNVNQSLGSFVKMSLVPDETKRTLCQTDMMDFTNPVFDEKFSFELLEEDEDKRLLLSVWYGDHDNKIYEFCGCMSFGITNLIDASKQSARGWYCLLAEEVGRRKHLRYSSRSTNKLSTKHLEKHAKSFKMETRKVVFNDAKNILKILKHLSGQRTNGFNNITLRLLKIKRSKQGFGFTVPSVWPVSVGYVSRGSPSEKAGLQSGDTIVRVNGANVSRFTAPTVIKLINHSWEYLILDIQRKRKEIIIEKFEKSPWKPFLSGIKN